MSCQCLMTKSSCFFLRRPLGVRQRYIDTTRYVGFPAYIYLNAVLRDGDHRLERVCLRPDLYLLHVDDERRHVVDAGMGDGVKEGSVLEVDAHTALLDLVDGAHDDHGHQGHEHN